MEQIAGSRMSRRSIACDECKRRKVRCSAEARCANCVRDNKRCIYSSPVHRASALEGRVKRYEALLGSIQRAWEAYIPNVPLEKALENIELGSAATTTHPEPALPISRQDHQQQQPQQRQQTELPSFGSPVESSSQQSDHGIPEYHNPDDFEFDESQEYGDAIDGMGLLTLEPYKSGYTGPQSGVAALKFLRSLPIHYGIDEADEDFNIVTQESQTLQPQADAEAYVDDYFQLYHPAYPLIHEGTFRARMSGAVAKPPDGSWPLLYNMVLAMGAFVGDSVGALHDLVFFNTARESVNLSVVEKGSLSYVQGLTLLADYLQRRNKPNAGFAIVGIAWSMGMAIGLHREFSPDGTTAFAMELRRRTWWTLYNVVSGAQLTLGRPPASLAGINVRLPTNLDDRRLAVDMVALPPPKEGATVTSSLIAQVGLARITNEVQTELLNSPDPDAVDRLDRSIEIWLASLPVFFDAENTIEWRFELPKRVLLWRSYHLRVVLNRPFLFQAVSQKAELSQTNHRIQRCISAADTCVKSIHWFLTTHSGWKRGFAWYATYCLISASFIHAICLAYAPRSSSAEQWQSRLREAIEVLDILKFAHSMADRAKKILQQFLGTLISLGLTLVMGLQNSPAKSPTAQKRQAQNLPQFVADTFAFTADDTLAMQTTDFAWLETTTNLDDDLIMNNDSAMMWPSIEASSAAFIQAAGANLFQQY